MQGEWIREPKGKASVVFVHGILSSGEAAWANEHGAYWPQLLKDEESLNELGIYVYTYQTGILSGSYSLNDVVDDLKERMKLDKLFESKQIVFVCHSMGGLVVRKFLVERLIDLIQHEIEIGLFLVASPSLGSKYADWLSQLANLLGNVQVTALRFNQENTWLNDLDKQFINLKESKNEKFKLKIEGKELIEDKFVRTKKLFSLFWRKQVVEPFSGARYFGEPYKVPDSDHRSIAKPENKGAMQHRLLCEFIRGMVIGQPDKKSLQAPIEGKGDREAERLPTIDSAQQPESVLSPRTVFRDPLKDGSQGPEMVVIPTGTFQMGDINGNGSENERPVHPVMISRRFAMGRYEVTFEEYDQFAMATGRKSPTITVGGEAGVR